MVIDLLDIESGELYFDEPLNEEAMVCLDQASESYGNEAAENRLMRAYFIEPQHPMVLVALYRFFFYQHRFEEALLVAERTLRIFAARLDLPEDWRDLDSVRLGNSLLISMTLLRFYMLALKGAGYLELRIGKYDSALSRLRKVADFDTKDRLGVKALIEVVQQELGQYATREVAEN